ncbi:MAG: hypothetical protein V7K48_03920 [Nostoc sp.]|uniref:hypothetical protein n=1 Tax=Nostoc sp. TaxID=1180 RepID=UPI002FF7BC6B
MNKKLDWQWNTNGNEEVINVYPHAGEAENAFYDRSQKALRFFYFTPPRNSGLIEKVFTCRSLDIVAHETGHAVLDSLKPDWILENAPAQTGGLHESYHIRQITHNKRTPPRKSYALAPLPACGEGLGVGFFGFNKQSSGHDIIRRFDLHLLDSVSDGFGRVYCGTDKGRFISKEYSGSPGRRIWTSFSDEQWVAKCR